MNVQRIALLITLFLCSTQLWSQKEYTIKLGTSSNYRDYFGLEQQIRMNRFSGFINTSGGNKNDFSNSSKVILGDQNGYIYDSIAFVATQYTNYRYVNIDLGFRYHFAIHGLDYYYAGFSGGVGYEERIRDSYYETLDLTNPHYEIDPTHGSVSYDVLEYSTYHSFSNDMSWRINFMTGVNIPVAKRLRLNVELNAGFVNSYYEYDDILSFTFIPSIRGGISYLISKNLCEK